MTLRDHGVGRGEAPDPDHRLELVMLLDAGDDSSPASRLSLTKREAHLDIVVVRHR